LLPFALSRQNVTKSSSLFHPAAGMIKNAQVAACGMMTLHSQTCSGLPATCSISPEGFISYHFSWTFISASQWWLTEAV